jgi:DNA modification methylase
VTVIDVTEVPIEHLRPDPANPRRIDEVALNALERSIRRYGLVQPIVVRQEDQLVIAGHQRLAAARRLGMTTVPVLYCDLGLDDAHALGLALNRIQGEWDEPLLARMLATLQAAPEADLSLSGFQEDEISTYLRSLAAREKRDRPETFDLEAALDPADPASSASTGTLWTLGDHRLLCGDATKVEDVDRLMDGGQAGMAFTDPPYNVGYGDHGGQTRGQRKRRIANDAMPDAEWEAFCAEWTANLIAAVHGALYVCMSTKEWPTVSRLLTAVGGHWSDTIIWAKDRHVLGRADYQRAYEPIWYGWPDGVAHHWCGDRDQTNVWTIARPAVADLHPHMKPLSLVERAIENSSVPGEIVLDLFHGSGTTLIAAERTGRTCYGLELDPHYCAVAIARWESFTGNTATAVPAVDVAAAT